MIGIDLGVRKVTLFQIDGTPFGLHYETPKSERSTELADIAGYLQRLEAEGLLEGTKWVEAPLLAGMRNIQTTIAIAQTSGTVLSSLSDTHQVPVSSWKQRTVGKGNADKSAVRAWLDEYHPKLAQLCGSNQDLYDAACIGLYGREQARAFGLAGLRG
jgi:hypothetical protein